MAWDLLTRVYGLPKDRLYVTYFEGDAKQGLEPDSEAQLVAFFFFPFHNSQLVLGKSGEILVCQRATFFPATQRTTSGVGVMIHVLQGIFLTRRRNGRYWSLRSMQVRPTASVEMSVNLLGLQ